MFKTPLIAAAAILLLATSAEARPRHHHSRAIDGNGNDAVTYLPHPAGCPGTAFCGCGAAHALGLSDRRLWLASNWLHYYDGPTPVAVWSGHVAIIRQMYGDGTALMEDYNSGGHQSRLWRRSLAGARIVGGGAGAYTSSDPEPRHRYRHPHYAQVETPSALDLRTAH